MLKFVKHNDTKTLNGNVRKAEPEWLNSVYKREKALFDFIVIEKGIGIGTELHVCAANVGTRDYCLICTVHRQELSNKDGVGNCTNEEYINY